MRPSFQASASATIREAEAKSGGHMGAPDAKRTDPEQPLPVFPIEARPGPALTLPARHEYGGLMLALHPDTIQYTGEPRHPGAPIQAVT